MLLIATFEFKCYYIHLGSTGKRGPNRFYNNYFTVCQELPKDFIVEMPAKSKEPSKVKEFSNPSSPRSFNDSNGEQIKVYHSETFSN